eukprot:TRINITY_DN82379_c0_g1_i1.p1 TRINITY_DN82379_c0_g1~~TRINITY_DN82379_c0_g1_i1.p1  ORF type:complete len:495 (-),score=101.53 TRINITY_DN82379_c0_g1_i1:290-1774(-)
MGGGASSNQRYQAEPPRGSAHDAVPRGQPPALPPRSLTPPKGSASRGQLTPGLETVPPAKPKKGGKPAEEKVPSLESLKGVSWDDHALIMAADVGGTNSRLMLYRVGVKESIERQRRAPGTLIYVKKYANLLYSSLTEIIEVFMEEVNSQPGAENLPAKPEVACLAVAGVASQNTARLTNLDWLIDGDELQQKFGMKQVEVINDFVAQGYGVLTLGDDEVQQLAGPPASQGDTIACIGAGTGLGQCFLTSSANGEYTCWPSEGGHAEFAPRGAGNDETQIELLKYLKIKFSGWNRISAERIVSGRGICNVYEFLSYTNPNRVNEAMHEEFKDRSHDAGIISKHAYVGSLCEETLQLFANCYGSVCGTFALQLMPFGGLYLTGGVTQRLAGFLKQSPQFLQAFFDKGRVSPMLNEVPVFLVKGDEMGQRGAHLRAVKLVQKLRKAPAPKFVRQRSARHLPEPRGKDMVEFNRQLSGLRHESKRVSGRSDGDDSEA